MFKGGKITKPEETMKYPFFYAVLLFCASLFPATHVFWYEAQTNAYNLQQCDDKGGGKTFGPCISAGAIVHQGITATGTVAQHSGNSEAGSFNFGSGLDDAQGRCAFFWSSDLSAATGTVTAAKIRGEYKDGFSGNAMCNAGPISIRCGVADFQGNIDLWGSPELVAETATWQDFLNPMSSTMGYDLSNPTLGAEEIISVTAPVARTDASEPSVLDGEFFEVDVTEQVNFILANAGQHAIVLLVAPGQGSTGKIGSLAAEDGVRPNGADNPWSQDGNTLHCVVESADLEIAVETKPGSALKGAFLLAQNSPNPFKGTTAISYDTGNDHLAGTIEVFTLNGKRICSETVRGQGGIKFKGGNLGSGVYYYTLTAGGRTLARKMIIAGF